MGYCPFLVCAWSRYSKLYRDTAGLGAQQEGHDTARTRPRYGPVRARHKAQRERHDLAHTQHGFYLAIQFCIVTREGLPPETGIPGFRDSTVPISWGTGTDAVCFSISQYG